MCLLAGLFGSSVGWHVVRTENNTDALAPLSVYKHVFILSGGAMMRYVRPIKPSVHESPYVGLQGANVQWK